MLPSTKPFLYSSIIFGGFVFNGTLPLLFELVMECVYPVGGGIAGGIVMVEMSAMLLFFDIAFMLPHSDIRGMNWVLTSVLGIGVIGMVLFREKYTRLDLDNQMKTDSKSNAC